MAAREPLVINNGETQQLQELAGDTLVPVDSLQVYVRDLERRFRLLMNAWVQMNFPIPPGLENDALSTPST